MADKIDNEVQNSAEESKNNEIDFSVKVFEQEENSSTNDVDDLTNKENYVQNNTEDADPDYEDYVPDENDDFEVEELNSETAFNFLKQEKGIDAENFEEYVEKLKFQNKDNSEELPEDVVKFLQFKKETGNNSYEDFLATQKDWKAEDESVVLKTLLKSKNPTLSEKEIDFLFKKNYSYDEELDEEDVVMEKTINKKRDLQDAYTVLDEQKEKYKVNRGSENNIPEEFKTAKQTLEQINTQQEANKKLVEQLRSDFLNKTDQVFSNNFEGFKVKVGNEEFVLKPQNIQETKTLQSDIANFEKKFFDDNNNITDPEGYHRALYFAMNPDAVAEHYINIGKAMQLEQEEKESKNINMDSKQAIHNSNPSGIQVKVYKG